MSGPYTLKKLTDVDDSAATSPMGEFHVVLAGSGRVKFDDEIVEIEPLDAIRIAPGVVRQFEAGPGGWSCSSSDGVTTATAS